MCQYQHDPCGASLMLLPDKSRKPSRAAAARTVPAQNRRTNRYWAAVARRACAHAYLLVSSHSSTRPAHAQKQTTHHTYAAGSNHWSARQAPAQSTTCSHGSVTGPSSRRRLLQYYSEASSLGGGARKDLRGRTQTSPNQHRPACAAAV